MKVVPASLPSQPTAREVEARGTRVALVWCEACVRGRVGHNDHRRLAAEQERTIVALAS